MNTKDPQPIDTTTAKLIADLARRADAQLATPRKAEYLDAAPYLVLRDAAGNERVEHLKQRVEAPHRKTGTTKIDDTESFITFYGMHAANGVPIYAHMDPARFVAVLNDDTKDSVGYGDHRAEFTVKFSPEWTEWTKHNGRGAAFGTNEAFALFLENNAPDIVKPDAATMLSIALNFRVKADAGFAIVQRLEDGNVELAFNNTVQGSATGAGGGKVKIPEQFSIKVPVFAGPSAPTYGVDARFRYRLKDSCLTMWYDLVRPQKVVERAFKDIVERITKDTKAKVIFGMPAV